MTKGIQQRSALLKLLFTLNIDLEFRVMSNKIHGINIKTNVDDLVLILQAGYNPLKRKLMVNG